MTTNSENNKGKKHISNRLLILLSFLALVCMIFFIVANWYACGLDGFKKEIKIVKDGTTIDSMEIKSLSLHPGESVDYQVVLNAPMSGSYQVTLDFNEKVDGGLKQFIVVVINDGSKNVLNKGLSDVLAGDKITLTCNIEEKKPYVLDISYVMPEDVNNDAMGTTATFEIEFCIVLL